jgi:hypothetical protein
MSLRNDIEELSPLRKNQQLMSFYMLFVASLMLAYTAKTYISVFGANGVILKDYAICLFSLILLIPAFGKIATKYPIKTFYYCVVLEFIAMGGYFIASENLHPEIILPLSTTVLMTSVYALRPIVTRVDSLVTDGCAEYSLIKSKLDSIYLSTGSLFGGLFIIYDISSYITMPLLIISLLASRYYRNLVFNEIYSADENKPELSASLSA